MLNYVRDLEFKFCVIVSPSDEESKITGISAAPARHDVTVAENGCVNYPLSPTR